MSPARYTFNQLPKKIHDKFHEDIEIQMERKVSNKESTYFWNTANGEGGAVYFDINGNEIED